MFASGSSGKGLSFPVIPITGLIFILISIFFHSFSRLIVTQFQARLNGEFLKRRSLPLAQKLAERILGVKKGSQSDDRGRRSDYPLLYSSIFSYA